MTRDIYIGDVHGCASELGALLDRVGPTEGDRVLFVGDLVARGPDSRGVLRLFREASGLSVLGNHEARLLEVRRARQKGEQGPPIGPSHEALLNDFAADDWTLLESLPHHLDVPSPGGGARIVHAGVDPARPFDEQDLWTLLHVRSIGPGGVPSDRTGDVSWSASYAGDPHIVFGHDARRGVQLEAHATGLDSACVYGELLTALVIPQGLAMPPPVERRGLLVSVRARAAYYVGHQ